MTMITANTTTLITGASSGIGRAFAHKVAAAGGNLVLVARREDVLIDLATELTVAHAVRATVIAQDLNQPEAGQQLFDELQRRGLEIDVLINNAGLGIHGDLATTELSRATTQIGVNVTSLTTLTALLLPAMVARHQGAIINVASTAAFQPVAHMAVYSATKAYVLSFTQALWRETRGTGVDVLALCPGATDTAFFDTAGDAAAVGARRAPAQVVDSAFRALERGKHTVVDGRGNAFVAWLAPRLPRRLTLEIAERSVRP